MARWGVGGKLASWEGVGGEGLGALFPLRGDWVFLALLFALLLLLLRVCVVVSSPFYPFVPSLARSGRGGRLLLAVVGCWACRMA